MPELLHLPGLLYGRVAVATATPRKGGKGRAARPVGEGLCLYTFVSDQRLYDQMVASFTAAGFPRDPFVKLSDRETDPYRAINELEPSCRYAILCHQDLLADRGAGLEDLLRVLGALDHRDPDWIVAGNAGVTRNGRVVRRVYDEYGDPTGDRPPIPVVTLDENFLVFNMRHTPRTSPGLSGFHLYGTDVVLNALADGGSAYVIEFPLTHVPGGGTSANVDYGAPLRRFEAAWNPRTWWTYVFTPQDVLFLSRSRILRRLFGSERARAWVRRRRGIRR